MKFLITGTNSEMNKNISSLLASKYNLDNRYINEEYPSDSFVYTNGITNISSYDDEELRVLKMCFNEKINCIICVIDPNNTLQSLNLLIKLNTLNTSIFPIVVDNNILSSSEIANIRQFITEDLYLDYVFVQNTNEIEPIYEKLQTFNDFRKKRSVFPKIFADDVYNCLFKVENSLVSSLFDAVNPKFMAILLFNGDPYFSKISSSYIENNILSLEETYSLKRDEILADQIYDYLNSKI